MNQKFALLVFLMASLTMAVEAQVYPEQSMNWYFGINAGLRFDDYPPSPLTDGRLVDVNCAAVMSDDNGELLFYCDNETVFNRDHEVMENGRDLGGSNGNVSQTVIITRRPAFESRYYIFMLSRSPNQGKLLLNEVDMSDGLGRIVRKSDTVYHTLMTSKMSAVNHRNGTDIWLMTQGLDSARYYAFRISMDGIVDDPIISDFGHSGIRYWDYGQLKFSPDGRRMAIANENTQKNLLMYLFDDETGMLSNEIEISYASRADLPRNVEFAPSGRVLYVVGRESFCSPTRSTLRQYDLSSWDLGAVQASETLISSTRKNYGFLQVALDGRIYVGGRTSDCEPNTNLHVIEEPERIGMASSFREEVVSLAGASTFEGLPNFNQSTFYREFLYLDDSVFICRGESRTIDAGLFAEYDWSTGSTERQITVSESGWYGLTVKTSRGRFLTDSTYVQYYESETLTLPDGLSVCEGEAATISAGDFASYSWNTGELTKEVTKQAGTYSVLVTDSNGCTQRDTIVVSNWEPPSITLLDAVTICEGDSIVLGAGAFSGYLWSTGSVEESVGVTEAGTYSVTVIDERGCSNSDSVLVVTEECFCLIEAPNVFTPNEDGVNDTFELGLPVGLSQFRMQVVDRSGKQIFQTTDWGSPWDGKVNGTKVDTGTYFWFATVGCSFQGGRTESFRGTVNVLY